MTEDRPASRVISGVEVVTIPIAEYAELLDCRRRLAELAPSAKLPRKHWPSPIDRDREVATFLAERLGQAPGKVILAECSRRFGPARTPSKSALNRYWHRLRAQAREHPEDTG